MKPFPPLSPDGSRSFPRKELSKGVGEWNHYYVRAINGEIRLWVNGEEVSGGRARSRAPATSASNPKVRPSSSASSASANWRLVAEGGRLRSLRQASRPRPPHRAAAYPYLTWIVSR